MCDSQKPNTDSQLTGIQSKNPKLHPKMVSAKICVKKYFNDFKDNAGYFTMKSIFKNICNQKFVSAIISMCTKRL